MKSRSELRDIIVKVIYQINLLTETDIEYKIDELITEQLEVKNDFVNSCVYGIVDKQDELKEIANKYLNNWTIDRLNKVDQAILLLGIFELKYTDTPSVVAINEAIELSKKYSDEAVTKMINGVLDKVYHELEK